MSELPSLTTIKQISSGDTEFENKLISIIKRELPLEIELYNENYRTSNFILVADSVHKLNHKINIFGLEEGILLASKFENELRQGSGEMKAEFDGVLQKITQFINSI